MGILVQDIRWALVVVMLSALLLVFAVFMFLGLVTGCIAPEAQERRAVPQEVLVSQIEPAHCGDPTEEVEGQGLNSRELF